MTLENIESLHRENVVQEISELVHRQLVTSSLESTFRNVLEITMQVHISLCLTCTILQFIFAGAKFHDFH